MHTSPDKREFEEIFGEENAVEKGAMCNGRLHIMARAVSVFPLKLASEKENT